MDQTKHESFKRKNNNNKQKIKLKCIEQIYVRYKRKHSWVFFIMLMSLMMIPFNCYQTKNRSMCLCELFEHTSTRIHIALACNNQCMKINKHGSTLVENKNNAYKHIFVGWTFQRGWMVLVNTITLNKMQQLR